MAGKMRVIICLLRNDLRYHDNEILAWAHRNGDHVLPLYCFDPRHFGPTYHFGFQKTGPHRTKFLLESVIDLRATLRKHGSDLIIRKGEPEMVVPQLIQQLGKENVFGLTFQEECTEEELDVEKKLKKSAGVPVHTAWGSTLYNKEDVPFALSQVPDVFTQFRKRVEAQCPIRSPVIMPDQLRALPPGIDPGLIPTYAELGVKEPQADERTAFPFKGGESTGLERVKDYLWNTDNVAQYVETRNGMIGAEYSTKFAAWLAHGCLSPRHINSEIKRYEGQRTANKSTYWVIFELTWRDYFKFVALKYGNQLFHSSGIMGKRLNWKVDMKLFDAWREGRTGAPYVDANMRELARTGFMSNRGRQNVASYLTKDLKLDWRLGAEWFESQLVDHDVCSNYGNWQYSAGIGNDPRQDRKFNIVKQGLDYDANGDYIRLWVPELARIRGGEIHTPWALNGAVLSHAGVSLGENYPHPIVIAPEWSRQTKRGGGSAGGHRGGKMRGGHSHTGRGQQRGIDFYFKGNNFPK